MNEHYQHKIQPIEYIQQLMVDLPIDGFEGACIKDIIKYSSRYGLKDTKLNEAGKILDYALWLYLDALDVKIKPNEYNHKVILDKLGIIK